MCYVPPLLSHFSLLRFSVQLERRCSPSRNAFSSSRLVFPRGIINFLAIGYSDNFRKTCKFSICMDPRHFVFRHLGVSADQHILGALLAAKCKKCFWCFNRKKCKTSGGKRPRKKFRGTEGGPEEDDQMGSRRGSTRGVQKGGPKGGSRFCLHPYKSSVGTY